MAGSSITVVDTANGVKKSAFVAPAGLAVTAQIEISALAYRGQRVCLTASPAGRFVVLDDAGDELARYDASPASVADAAKVDTTAMATPKQITFLWRLITGVAGEEFPHSADAARALITSGQMTKVLASQYIDKLTAQ